MVGPWLAYLTPGREIQSKHWKGVNNSFFVWGLGKRTLYLIAPSSVDASGDDDKGVSPEDGCLLLVKNAVSMLST